MRSRLLACIALASGLAVAVAQTPRLFHVQGIVVDQDGRPVPSARVQLGDQQSETTDSMGAFHFTLTTPGPYQATVTTPFGQTVVQVQGGNIATITIPDFKGKAAAHPSGSTAVSINDLEAPPKAKSALAKAETALNRGDFPNAKKFVNQAIHLASNWARPYALRAVLEFTARDYASARSDFQTAIAHDPHNGMTLTELGQLYTVTGNFALSRTTLQQALQIPPVPWQTYLEMARLDLMQRNYVEAAGMSASAMQCKPAPPASIHFLDAEAEYHLNHFRRSAQQFSLFLKQAPHSPAFAAVRKAAQSGLLASRRQLPHR